MRPLRIGDTIGFVSPATTPVPDTEGFVRSFVATHGYRARFFGNGSPAFGRMSASDEIRANAINDAFSSPDISAIICTRGGYGSGRLTELLDYDLIRQNPKPFVGYSDITNLLMEIANRAGIVTFHGPMVTDFASKSDSWSIEQMLSLVSGAKLEYVLNDTDAKCHFPGRARGRLFGGNLSILSALAGTTKLTPDDDVVLLLEDVGEFLFRLDRSLVQLSRTDLVRQAKAILVADMQLKDDAPDNSLGFSFQEVLNQHFGPLGIPIAYNVSAGHTQRQLTLPVGAWTKVDIAPNRTKLSFSGIWNSGQDKQAA